MSASSARKAWLGFASWVADTPMFRPGRNVGRGLQNVLRHGVPDMPVTIDEEETDRQNVLEFVGRPLDTVIDDDALSGKMLHLFSDRAKAADYVDSTRSSAAQAPRSKARARQSRPRAPEYGTVSQALTAGVPPGGGVIELFQLTDLGGCSWRIVEWGPDLTCNYDEIWACGFLFWGWINADDRISSIESVLSADVVIFADQLNLGGSWGWVGTGKFRINDLALFGWDDRISSQTVLYLS